MIRLSIALLGIVLAFSEVVGRQADTASFAFSPSTSGTRLTEVLVVEGVPPSYNVTALAAELDLPADERCWKGWLTYGAARSGSIAVWIVGQPDNRRCYVDKNRDRIFQRGEMVASTPIVPDEWVTDLDAWYFVGASEQPEKQASKVRFRFDAGSLTCQVATAGTMNGSVKFDGKICAARFEDRNANGLWFDPDDRLFVDLNADGKINSIVERLPCEGMRMIGGRLHSISGDASGRSLALSPVLEKGSIVPKLGLDNSNAKIISIQGALGSDSGINIPVSNIDQAIEVPVGNWFVKDIRIEVSDGENAFLFQFESLGTGDAMIVVKGDQTTDIELLGALTLTATVNSVSSGRETTILVTPMLTSKSGCYLHGSEIGKEEPTEENRLAALSFFRDEQIAVGSSGFS